MSTNAFDTNIPKIWSAKLVEKFYATTVLSAIKGEEYELMDTINIELRLDLDDDTRDAAYELIRTAGGELLAMLTVLLRRAPKIKVKAANPLEGVQELKVGEA